MVLICELKSLRHCLSPPLYTEHLIDESTSGGLQICYGSLSFSVFVRLFAFIPVSLFVCLFVCVRACGCVCNVYVCVFLYVHLYVSHTTM